MDVLDQNLRRELLTWHERLFSHSIRRKEKLMRLKESLGSTSHQHCLLISAGDVMLAQKLRQNGTVWDFLAVTDASATGMGQVLNADISRFSGLPLAYEENTFDSVVIADALEYIEPDYEFIKECHRVLKSDGRLVITVGSMRNFGLIRGLKQLIGPNDLQAGRFRPGYTSRQLFDILKDGFDVPGITRYSGFFTELTGIWSSLSARIIAGPHYEIPPEQVDQYLFYKYRNLNAAFAIGHLFMWFSTILDKIFIMFPRYNLIAKTKTRAWRPRKIPVLADGRSIAEAALNTRIGTAVEF
jgi:SAM-dependent methyltransferase